MQVGDVVMFVGFFWEQNENKKHFQHHKTLPSDRGSGVGKIGIVVSMTKFTAYGQTENRVDVAWSDGTIGRALYENTLEVVSGAG